MGVTALKSSCTQAHSPFSQDMLTIQSQKGLMGPVCQCALGACSTFEHPHMSTMLELFSSMHMSSGREPQDTVATWGAAHRVTADNVVCVASLPICPWHVDAVPESYVSDVVMSTLSSAIQRIAAA